MHIEQKQYNILYKKVDAAMGAVGAPPSHKATPFVRADYLLVKAVDADGAVSDILRRWMVLVPYNQSQLKVRSLSKFQSS